MSLREARAEDDGRRRDVVVLRVVLDSMIKLLLFVASLFFFVSMRCYDVMSQDIMRLLNKIMIAPE